MKLLSSILFILLLPVLSQADILCGDAHSSYYFEFINHGQFQTPTAYMVDIYVNGDLWKQEEGLNFSTRGTTYDGYEFGIIDTKVGPQQDIEVKIKSKGDKHILVFVQSGVDGHELPCIVRQDLHQYRPQQKKDHFQPLETQGFDQPSRLPASSIFQ